MYKPNLPLPWAKQLFVSLNACTPMYTFQMKVSAQQKLLCAVGHNLDPRQGRASQVGNWMRFGIVGRSLPFAWLSWFFLRPQWSSGRYCTCYARMFFFGPRIWTHDEVPWSQPQVASLWTDTNIICPEDDSCTSPKLVLNQLIKPKTAWSSKEFVWPGLPDWTTDPRSWKANLLGQPDRTSEVRWVLSRNSRMQACAFEDVHDQILIHIRCFELARAVIDRFHTGRMVYGEAGKS